MICLRIHDKGMFVNLNIVVVTEGLVHLTVYPTLDTSDTEDIFKPRGKQKRDDTWNPKGRSIVTFRSLSTYCFNVKIKSHVSRHE